MKPCKGWLSQRYGKFPQASGQPWIHVGDDYAGNRGDEVVTISDGTVLYAGPGQNVPNWLSDLLMLYRGSDASGNCVIIQHDGWVETANHLEFYTVSTGMKVKRGWRIGGMGDSGNAFGVHLHHECLTTPASSIPPFSRYDPHFQIAHENAQAMKFVHLAKDIDMKPEQFDALIKTIEDQGAYTREYVGLMFTKGWYTGRGANRKFTEGVALTLAKIKAKVGA